METKNRLKNKNHDLPNLNQCFSLDSTNPQAKERPVDTVKKSEASELKIKRMPKISMGWLLLFFCILGGAGGALLVDTLVKDENFERKMIKIAKQSLQSSKSVF